MIIYVLKLQNNKYYVGKTDNFQKRIQQHFSGIGGSYWTKLYKPIEVIRKFEINNTSLLLSSNKKFFGGLEEDKIVKEMMCLYGIDNVRGGSYVQEIIENDAKEFLKKELRFVKDLCVSCGSGSHFIKDCDKIIVYECEICNSQFNKKSECEYHIKKCYNKKNIMTQTEPPENVNKWCCIIC